jgi:hypothetical protein
MGSYSTGIAEPRRVFDGAHISKHGQGTDTRHAHQQTTFWIIAHECPDDLIERGYLLAKLAPACQHGRYDDFKVGSVDELCFNTAVKPSPANTAW